MLLVNFALPNFLFYCLTEEGEQGEEGEKGEEVKEGEIDTLESTKPRSQSEVSSNGFADDEEDENDEVVGGDSESDDVSQGLDIAKYCFFNVSQSVRFLR